MAPRPRNVFTGTGSTYNEAYITSNRAPKPPVLIYIDPTSTEQSTRPINRKRQNSSTALRDLPNNTVNSRIQGQRRGKRARTAQSARNLDVAATSQQAEIQNTQRRQIIRPQQQNAHFRPRSAQSGVQQVIQVVVPPRNPDDSSPPEYRDSSSEEEAPPPEPRYHLRTRQLHTQWARENSEERALRQRRRRRPYQRRNAVDEDGRTLPSTHLSARLPQVHIDLLEHVILPLFFDLTNKCPHCHAFSFEGERLSTKRWQCCQNGMINIQAPDSPDFEFVERLPEYDPERRVLALNKLFYEVEYIRDGQNRRVPDDILGPGHYKMKRTARSAAFVERALNYNNLLSFTSEGVDKMDHRVGRTTCKIQGGMYHAIGPLLPEEGVTERYAQCYFIDNSQDQVDTRMTYAGQVERSIDADIVLLLQRLLRDINPYVQSFKTCRERLLDNEARHPLQTMNVRIIQHDPRRADRGTHNRPTSSEVACIMIAPPNGAKGRIARDIRIEVKGGGLMRVPEWHSSYMALRYVLHFPFGEQSWHDSLPLRGHERLPEGHLFATRRLNIRQRTLYNIL